MTARDTIFGVILCLLALVLGGVYFYALLGPGGYALLAIEIVVSIGLVGALLLMFWVGYTIVTTPSIEEIEAKK